MNVRALIVDDEAPARRQLRRLLSALPDIHVVGEADTASSAIQRITASPPDVVFLDVAMPDMDGLGLIGHVGVAKMPLVVFVTAHERAAVAAFAMAAVDYLLKPVAPERLEEAMARVRARLSTPAAEAPPASAAVQSFARRLLLDDGPRQRFVAVEEILRIDAARHGCSVEADGRFLRTSDTLGQLLHLLHPTDFVQVNRSTIVNLRFVREVQPWSHGDAHLVLTDGRRVVWSRRYRQKR